MENLIQQILEEHSPRGKAVMERFVAEHTRGTRKRQAPTEEVVHCLVDYQPSEGAKKRKPGKRCRICSKEKRKETRKCCPGCPGSPGLCSTKCFKEWHKGKQ